MIYTQGVSRPVRELMLPPGYACHFSALAVIMPRWLLLWFRGIAGLDSFASALEACMAPSGTMKTSSHVGDIQSFLDQGPWALCLRRLVSSAIGT